MQKSRFSFKKPCSFNLLTPKTIAFAIICSFIIFSLILWFFSQPQPQEPPTPKPIQVITPPKPITNKTITRPSKDLVALALQTGNASYCANSTKPQYCYQLLMKVDPLACINLKDTILRDDCAIFWAKKTNNESFCQYVSSKKIKECLAYFHKPCENASDKNLCLALYYSNKSYCQDDNCFFNYAIEKNDAKACDDIRLSGLRYACLSIIARQDRCKELEGDFSRDYCYWMYAKTTKFYNTCYKVTTDSYKTKCFTDWAVDDGYMQACEEVTLLERWDCYTSYALAHHDPNGCEAISKFAEGSKNNCFYKLAMNTSNPCLCNSITNSAMRNMCYGELIFSNKTIEEEDCYCLPERWESACLRHHS